MREKNRIAINNNDNKSTSTSGYDNTPQWYVINTCPKQENRAEHNLKAWQVETFLPKLRCERKSQYTSKSSFFMKPLFPGYLFARFNGSVLTHKINFTRGVRSIVSFGGIPAIVQDNMIEMIRSNITADGLIVKEKLSYGDRVVIEEGPFRELCGIFEDDVAETERIKILLTTIEYQAHLLVNRQQVRRT